MHTTKMHASFMPVVKLYDLKFAMHSNAIMPEIAHVYIMLSAKMVNWCWNAVDRKSSVGW